VATSRGGCAAQRYSLGTRQADGALVAVEEDTAAMAKLLLTSLVAKSCNIVIGLLVGEEEKQTQEFTMYAARCRHARRKSALLFFVRGKKRKNFSYFFLLCEKTVFTTPLTRNTLSTNIPLTSLTLTFRIR
jgi:hypothetical protein